MSAPARPAPPIARSPDALRRAVADWRRDGARIALVPTMGALHDGHLSLVGLARERADRVAASLFVNPTQFAAGEDLDAYPRDEARDAALLAAHGCDLLYAPDAGAIYPPGFATTVVVAGPAEGLESAARPHFFRGVATVVTKLLVQAAPDVAVFGEKDYQQLLVIRRLAADLDLPVEILAGPTVREADGLAMSSRNAYLSHHDRVIAPLLHRTLVDVAGDLAEGRPVEDAVAAGRTRLEIDGFELDYLEVRHAQTLGPVGALVQEPARVFAAVHLGQTRLIDNVPVGAE
ncbi:MAG: pantoate--beta-alanine ligase [Caulobacterales bacterium]|nr:pantoate--beta-alanine ligase [Caulobacterales bacterium]